MDIKNLLCTLALLTTAFLSGLNTTDIYVVNKTKEPLLIGDRIKESHGFRIKTKIIGFGKPTSSPMSSVPYDTKKPVGKTVYLKPNDRMKLCSIDRDQSQFFMFIDPLGFTARQESETVDNIRIGNHTLGFRSWCEGSMCKKSSFEVKLGGTFDWTSTLPYTQEGLKIRSYYQFPKLYHDVEVIVTQ
jgi:hypothetical protein